MGSHCPPALNNKGVYMYIHKLIGADTRAAPALPGGGRADVGNVGMKDSAVLIEA